MYKLLLCLRYLRTRWIALASIVSVMLGVATMIVVNSVMAGFAREMEDRIHGVLADLSFQARDFNGAPDAEWHMEQIRRVAGEYIEGMTPVVVVPGMLNFRVGGNWMTQQVEIVGIDEQSHSLVSDYARYLQHPENRRRFSWSLREGGYDVYDHQAGPEAPARPQMGEAGWNHRRYVAEREMFEERLRRSRTPRAVESSQPGQGSSAVSPPLENAVRDSSMMAASPAAAPAAGETVQTQTTESSGTAAPRQEPAANAGGPTDPNAGVATGATASPSPPATDPFLNRADPFAPYNAANAPAESTFDPRQHQHSGAVLGIAMAAFRGRDGADRFILLPGDDVKLAFPTVGMPPKILSDEFTIIDLYESKMSEYDSRFVFVPIRKLQELRGMIDPSTGVGMFNSIQIKLKPGVDGDMVRDLLAAQFPEELFIVATWRDKQGALLAAVQMETAILNVLLFLIIAVAGFGILAIFFMIVFEKTRDIGILKSLGAHGRGVMGIFLGYGLSLGAVGSGVGMVMGLLFVRYINEIADLLGRITGRKVFDPSIYYFYSIPAIVEPATVAWIVGGAMLIAVAASVAPAMQAARLHPVEALRYE